MATWSEQEFLGYMEREPWFTSGAIAVAQSIMEWASKNKRVSTSWSGPKVPVFNALADGKCFISISARKGWDVEIPFRSRRGDLLGKAKNQQVIARLQQMGIKTVNPQPLSPEHRRAIRLDSIESCLPQFLELLDWIVDELYAEGKSI